MELDNSSNLSRVLLGPTRLPSQDIRRAWNDEAFLGAASYPASWWPREAVYESAEGIDQFAVIATIAILKMFSLGYLYRGYRYLGCHCYILGVPS